MKYLLLFIFVCFTTMKADQEIGGIKIPGSIKVADQQLILNGAGTREKFWMDMYVGALFVKAKTQNASEIIAANEMMVMELTIVSGLITSQKMSDAVDEGFIKSTNNSLSALQARINQFKQIFKDEIKKGDKYIFQYEPSKGLSIIRNGKLSAIIPGLDFKKALFGIWLCDNPADKDLKSQLLGK
ncbi:MAG: hypothetical protein RL348_1186 [Bacteroidota bacterium]|jgi:hypothetical protein